MNFNNIELFIAEDFLLETSIARQIYNN